MNQLVLDFLDSKHSKPLPSLLEVSAETNAAFSGMLKSLSEVCTHTHTKLSCFPAEFGMMTILALTAGFLVHPMLIWQLDGLVRKQCAILLFHATSWVHECHIQVQWRHYRHEDSWVSTWVPHMKEPTIFYIWLCPCCDVKVSMNLFPADLGSSWRNR